MKERFRHIAFKGKTKTMINIANDIIEQLAGMGYTLTLRQLYYQLVARDVIPNKQSEYKRLGSILNDARLGGWVDWDAIEDRTRNVRSVAHWQSPEEIIESCAYSYRIDKWHDQPYRIEVWVEKDALVGVLEKACRGLDVAWFSCRGYTSQTAVYNTSKRLLDYISAGQTPVIIHLGDHDPSGKDMTRDIDERLAMFCGRDIDIRRIALNWDQIEEYSPPPNPAKDTDSRFEKYREEFGDESWELDALDPQVIDKLITDEVASLRDEIAWHDACELEKRMRDELGQCKERWKEVVGLLQTKPGEMSEFFQAQLKKSKRKTRKKK